MLMITTDTVWVEKYRFCPVAGGFFGAAVSFGGLYPKDLAFQSGAAAVGGDVNRLAAPFPVVFSPTGF
jgi:hypothetical protein